MILAWFQMIKIGKSNTDLFVAFAISFREERTKLPCQSGVTRNVFQAGSDRLTLFGNFSEYFVLFR